MLTLILEVRCYFRPPETQLTGFAGSTVDTCVYTVESVLPKLKLREAKTSDCVRSPSPESSFPNFCHRLNPEPPSSPAPPKGLSSRSSLPRGSTRPSSSTPLSRSLTRRPRCAPVAHASLAMLTTREDSLFGRRRSACSQVWLRSRYGPRLWDLEGEVDSDWVRSSPSNQN